MYLYIPNLKQYLLKLNSSMVSFPFSMLWRLTSNVEQACIYPPMLDLLQWHIFTLHIGYLPYSL